MIRLVLAGGHTLFRQGMRRLFEREPDILVVGEAVDSQRALELARTLQPTVMMMSQNLPGMGGLAVTNAVVSEFPAVGVIIVLERPDERTILQAIAMGALGYVLQEMNAPQVVATVRQVAQGQAALDTQIITRLVTEFRRLVNRANVYAGGPDGLTPRELELLRLVASGYSNKEIASALELAESTVKNRLSLLFQKIGAHDRTQAAVYALSRGLVELDAGSFAPAPAINLSL